MTVVESDGGEVQRIPPPGEMAARTRSLRWADTALGPIAGWSESLVSTVNMVLASPASTILMVGPELVVLYNDAYIGTLAERHPAALGMRGNVLWSDAWDAVGHQIEDVLARGTAFKFDNVLIPVVRDGELRNTYFTYSFSPVFESRGNSVLGVMCMAQDVTAAHQALLDLAESERKLTQTAGELQQLMDVTTDAVVSIDRNWRFTYVNATAHKTYARGRDLIGKRVWDEFPEVNYPGSPFLLHHEQAMNEGRASVFEAYYPEPLDIWIRTAVHPAPDGIVTFSQDITEDKRSAQVLLQTEKLAAVGRMASSIAHEINNPLEAVTNLLYIARGENDLSTVRQLLSTADDELRRVGVIANQTLAFHKQLSRPGRLAARDLLAGAMTVYRSKLANARITVDDDVREEHAVVVYEGEIRQVLNNLFSNAIDAMTRGGRLRVRSRYATDLRSGQAAFVLTVRDTGTGIATEKARKVFEAFYTTKGIGGTGLGLWISRDIVERHNGVLQMRSSQDARWHGTVFRIVLPLQNPAGEALKAQQRGDTQAV